MKVELKLLLAIIFIALICGAIFLVLEYNQFSFSEKELTIKTNTNTQEFVNLTIPAEHISLNLQIPNDNIIINANVPETPNRVPLYKGIVSDDDINRFVKYISPNWTEDKTSLPSEIEAPALAEMALEKFGGLPPDAVLHSTYTSVAYEQKSSGEITARYPKWVSVGYGREINGMPVTGDRDTISVDIGEKGELLSLRKLWRTIENTGQTVPVITPQAAIKKLQNGETIHKLQPLNSIVLDSIRLGYYERNERIQETILEPCWIFKSMTVPGVELLVYARQFANFTATPTYGKAPLTVFFTDISDASPTKWLWDFGDGTTATAQNPVHTYPTQGAYTVTLRASNDLGSDWISKTSYILIGKKAIVQHIDTKLDELKIALNAMNIPNGNKNGLMQKLENTKAKNSDALKFIDQNKETQTNSMLNADDNLMNAFMNEVNAQTKKEISTGDAVKLNDGATEIRGFIQKAIETPI